MKNIKDKEKLVRDLVNSFNDRDELHKEYKERLKGMFRHFIHVFINYYEDEDEQKLTPEDFIAMYVEYSCKKAEE